MGSPQTVNDGFSRHLKGKGFTRGRYASCLNRQFDSLGNRGEATGRGPARGDDYAPWSGGVSFLV